MAKATLKIRVVSPEETVFEGEAIGLVAPAWDGKVGIRPGHAPFLTLLGGGVLSLDLPGGGSEEFFLNRGVLKVETDRVTVLTEYAAAEAPAEFDPSDAWLDPSELEDVSYPGNPLV